MLKTVSQVQLILFWIFISLFAAVSIFHLVVCFLENEKLRHISKPFCMIMLGLAIVCVRPTAWPLYVAAFCGSLGDFLLLDKSKKKFVFGCVAFYIGHLCYIGYMLTILYQTSVMPWWGYLVALGLYAIVVGFGTKPMTKIVGGDKSMGFGGSVYFSILLVLIGSSMALAVLGPTHWYFLCLAGAFVFTISDSFLAATMFIKDVKRKNFYIMLTYLSAQALILLTLALF